MALGSALTDKARIIRTERGDRTEGGYKKVMSTGPWFRCRYDPGGEGEVRTAGGVRRARTSTLLVGRKATDGSEIEFVGSDVLEIDSGRFGTITMQLDGLPEIVAKKTSRIGWLCNLVQVNRQTSVG